MVGTARRVSPVRFHGLIALSTTLGLAAGFWWLFGYKTTWPWLLFSWLAAVNATAFTYYGYDKARARQGDNRVPEVVLHGLAALGGSPGSLLAMQLFRHKTVKGTFRLVFWLIVLLQALLIGWMIKIILST